MRALTNGEGEEDEVSASAGAEPGLGENGVVPNSEDLRELALQKPGGPAGPSACCGMIQRPSPVAVL